LRVPLWKNAACGYKPAEARPMIEKTTQSVANLVYHAHIY
jgi:hypothetical protein